MENTLFLDYSELTRQLKEKPGSEGPSQDLADLTQKLKVGFLWCLHRQLTQTLILVISCGHNKTPTFILV